MKKHLSLIILFLGVITTATQAQGIDFGVRAGVSLANIRGEDANTAVVSQYTSSVTNVELPGVVGNLDFGNLSQTDPRPLASFFVGAYMDLSLLDILHLEPGLFLASRGYRLENTIPGFAELDIVNRSYYLEIPVYARLFVADGFNVFAGPQVAILLSNTFRTDLSAGVGGFNLLNFDFENDNNSDLNSFDVGLALGVGYQFPFGLHAQLGYDLGLVGLANNAQAYNGVWKLGAGITF